MAEGAREAAGNHGSLYVDNQLKLRAGDTSGGDVHQTFIQQQRGEGRNGVFVRRRVINLERNRDICLFSIFLFFFSMTELQFVNEVHDYLLFGDNIS